MAEEKRSLFKKPTPPAGGVIGPDAEHFVRGSNTAEASRAEELTQTKTLHQVVKDKPKEEPKEEKEKRLTIDIPQSLHARVKSGCALEGTSIKDEVVAFLEKRFPAKP